MATDGVAIQPFLLLLTESLDAIGLEIHIQLRKDIISRACACAQLIGLDGTPFGPLDMPHVLHVGGLGDHLLGLLLPPALLSPAALHAVLEPSRHRRGVLLL